MVSHSVKIKEHKFKWKRIHVSVYECSQTTLHLKLRVFSLEYESRKEPSLCLYFFLSRMYKKKKNLSANVIERPTQKIQKIYYSFSF